MIEPLQTILFVLVAGGAAWFLYGPYQTYREDSARERLFDIRNAIFDLAADGKLSFDSDVYQEIRDILNSFIRYAHHLSLPRLLFYIVFMPQPPQKLQIDALLEKIEDAEVRRQVGVCFIEATQTLGRLMLWRSPVFCPLFYLIWLIAQHVSAIRQLIQQLKNRLEDKAISYSQS